jgi:hypothetical protein
MAKRVYFCFHYEDVRTFRVNVVRQHGVTKEDARETGFYDASIWEDAKKQGDLALKRLINSNLEYTSVTCALNRNRNLETTLGEVRNIKEL